MIALRTDELRALAEAVKEWNSTDVWHHEDCQYTAVIGDIDEDGLQYPIAEINADTYGHDGESLALANFYAAANPAVVLGLLDRIAELEAQLAAIGAGGVEQLRKRECLHHVAEQAQIDSEVQRDAEQYRWLRNMNDWHAEPRIEDADGTKWQLTFYTPQIIEDQSDDNNLDSAIDAARAAQGGV